MEKAKEAKKEKKSFLRKNRESAGEFTQDISQTAREIIKGKKNITKENEIFEEIYKFEEREEKKHSKYTKGEKRSFAVLFLIITNIILLAVCYIISFSNMDTTILSNSLFYALPAAVIPFWAWVKATNENFWAFHQRKRLFFYMCCINLFLVAMQFIYTLLSRLVITGISKIKPDAVLTENMLALLIYVGIATSVSIACIIIYNQFEPLITSKSLRKQIELFKYSHIHDSRDDREYKYDITTIKNLETGKPIPIKENDRMNQTEINGASGTGKTSSIFMPVIEKDADQKVKNREKRQEEFLKLIKEKKATIQGPLREFTESAIIPLGKSAREIENNRKAINKIKKKYADCGMTIIAPNASLIIEIIKLCQARGIKVNVLDPMYDIARHEEQMKASKNPFLEGQPIDEKDYLKYDNVRLVGINPFYVPIGLSEEERVIYISQAATVFAEVLIATNQMNGAAPDVYFTDISLSVSSNIAAVVMLAKNIEGKQAYIDDIQNCISNFNNINPYLDIIEKHYKINIRAQQKAGTNKGVDSDQMNAGRTTISQAAANGGVNDVKKNPYYQQLLFVVQELLGAGSEDMFSQARGLRNLINKVLQDTRIKTKLSEMEENNRIDFDRILSENEITVVNTAIELGKSASTTLGLFFILLHKVSVLRRPMDTRTPHFLWIDEASQYMHPCYEDMISLYRQYRCAVVITLQSLTQTEKSSSTAYLKNVFLGAGTHIVFGRLSAEEMKLYSEMAGIVREDVDQTSYTTSSILSTDPSYTESVRSTPTVTNILEGADLRLLDFQELTIFTIDNGRVLPGQLARVFFITEEAYDRRRYRTVLWEKVVPEAFKAPVEKPVQKKKKVKDIPVTMEIPEEEIVSIAKQTTKKADRIEAQETEAIETQSDDLGQLSMEELFALLNAPQGNSGNTEGADDSDELTKKLEALNNL